MGTKVPNHRIYIYLYIKTRGKMREKSNEHLVETALSALIEGSKMNKHIHRRKKGAFISLGRCVPKYC